MKLFADYHTHTTYSHGRGSILDNVLAAQNKGLTEIAITDHGIRHFYIGVDKRKIMEIRNEISRINDMALGIKVLMGMECNIVSMDGRIDLPKEYEQYFDIVLLGYHLKAIPLNMETAISIMARNYYAKAIGKNNEALVESNSLAMIAAIENNNINIITHPNARMPINLIEVAKCANKHNVAMEINCKGGVINKEDIETLASFGTMFAIDSDGHSPAAVGVFDKGIALAESANLNIKQIINAI